MRTVRPPLCGIFCPVLLLGLLLLMACSDTDPAPPPAPAGPALLGIGVSPLYPVLPIGDVIQFRATGYLEDRTTVNLTDVVDWQSWNTDILDISEALDWEGKALGVAEGSTRVRAVHDGMISNEVTVTVVDAQLEQLTISPSAVTLAAGESLQLVAEAAFSDGSHGEVTGSVEWLTSDPSIVTIWPGGEIDAEGEGLAYVTARWEGVGDSVTEATIAVQVVAPGQSLAHADLRVLAFSSSVIDDSVYWSVTLENSGGRAASTFWVELWVDRSGPPPAPPAVGDGYEVVSVLGAGETRVLNFTGSGLSPGTYSSWLLVDSLGVVPEADEGNNVAGPLEFTVDPGSAPGPDPVGTPDIELLWFEGFVVTDPDAVIYFIDVQNLGDGATGPFSLAVYGDQSSQPGSSTFPDDWVAVDSLEPGEIVYVAAEVSGTLSGVWHSWVVADPGDALAESDETNNVLDIQVVAD